MEADKNPFPKIDLFPRITRVVHFLFDHIQSEGLSDHNRGAAPALDKALYDQPTLPFNDGGRWDDMGNYTTSPENHMTVFHYGHIEEV